MTVRRSSRTVTSCVAGSIGVLALVGCGGDGPAEVDDLSPAVLAQQVRDLAAQAEELGYTEAAEILEDGAITDAEFRQAYLDSIACYEQAGVEVRDFMRVTTVNGYTYSYIHADIDEELDCGRRLAEFANQGWNILYQNTLTPEAAAIAADCYERNGHEAAGAMTMNDFREVDEEIFHDCLFEAAEEVADPPGEIIFGY